ncbi:hypothetical protein RM550_17105 [Streptomyces sp. DSM 41527]|uniref:Uncharacterized protein n=1 Tax=Streptomyces mooreae TaxID=3075523 RepID=A0ABU2T945_9ACTN|nr:hypothetical protein [Streptomyces sp. DSM 41527]MDT0457435.1 hypothetical protein [Streptomyces sp. DSM 41527]
MAVLGVDADGEVAQAACEAEELPQAQANRYHEAWCDDSQEIMPLFYR